MSGEMQIGVLGLGVMGKNLARNLQSRDFSVAVYNRTTAKMTEFIEEFGNDKFVGYESLADFVGSLELPRKILVMVPAKAVDVVLDQLAEILSPGDVIMDGGNSFFKDTLKRQEKLKAKNIELLGCGVSGGEEGALHGPSLMPGGSAESYAAFKPFLEAIAAKDFAGDPCVTYVGKGMAGHYVKMVHNGIEYGIMQLLAESYHCLRYGLKLSNEQTTEIYNSLNTGKNKSFLLDVMKGVSETKDEDGSLLLDKILDSAGQKGTGRWTAIEALDLGVAMPTLFAAIDQRNLSAELDLRNELKQNAELEGLEEELEVDKDLIATTGEEFTEVFYQASLISFIQGFELLLKGNKEHGLDLDMAEIARIWQGGCIIRTEMLKDIRTYFAANDSKSLMFADFVQEALFEGDWEIRDLLDDFADQILPGFAASWYYLLTLIAPRCGAEVIQGIRDGFGAHGYKRIDQEGSFHSQWFIESK